MGDAAPEKALEGDPRVTSPVPADFGAGARRAQIAPVERFEAEKAQRAEFVEVALDIPNSDPPAVRVISDNRHYSAYERTVDEIHIVGRIRWFAREI